METEGKQHFETPGALSHDAKILMANARELLEVTKDVADEKIVAARKRLNAALESGKHTYADLREKVADGAKAADKTVRDHPYESIAIAFGIGAILGYVLSRRK